MDISVVPRDNPDYDEAQEESETQTSNEMLDVFDVLLAGVEADD